jgi:hypothetical protein|tara:strand:- start:429 stop:608 length:180 start_codon:yes stop_codon:yes gene_type:complete
MIDTDKYEDNNGWLDVHYGKIAHLLAEVKELRAWKKLVSDIVKQQNGPHLREMLKELIE